MNAGMHEGPMTQQYGSGRRASFAVLCIIQKVPLLALEMSIMCCSLCFKYTYTVAALVRVLRMHYVPTDAEDVEFSVCSGAFVSHISSCARCIAKRVQVARADVPLSMMLSCALLAVPHLLLLASSCLLAYINY